LKMPQAKTLMKNWRMRSSAATDGARASTHDFVLFVLSIQ
jgi:hypothetical protein